MRRRRRRLNIHKFDFDLLGPETETRSLKVESSNLSREHLDTRMPCKSAIAAHLRRTRPFKAKFEAVPT